MPFQLGGVSELPRLNREVAPAYLELLDLARVADTHVGVFIGPQKSLANQIMERLVVLSIAQGLDIVIDVQRRTFKCVRAREFTVARTGSL